MKRVRKFQTRSNRDTIQNVAKIQKDSVLILRMPNKNKEDIIMTVEQCRAVAGISRIVHKIRLANFFSPARLLNGKGFPSNFKSGFSLSYKP